MRLQTSALPLLPSSSSYAHCKKYPPLFDFKISLQAFKNRNQTHKRAVKELQTELSQLGTPVPSFVPMHCAPVGRAQSTAGSFLQRASPSLPSPASFASPRVAPPPPRLSLSLSPTRTVFQEDPVPVRLPFAHAQTHAQHRRGLLQRKPRHHGWTGRCCSSARGASGPVSHLDR